MLTRDLIKRIDWTLVITAFAIFALGLVSLYSATYANQRLNMPTPLIFKQMIWMAVGIAAFFIAVAIGYSKIVDFAYPLYCLDILLLIAVLLFGSMRLGARRWFDLGPFAFQPSELTKIAIILALARYLGYQTQESRTRGGGLKGLTRSFSLPILMVSLPMFLILKEPDLGTSLVLVPILLVMLYLSRISLKYLIWLGIIGFSSMPFFWHILRDYQKERLLVFIDPNIDPLGAGYTVIQSKIAIGSGGLLGKGWLAGTQNQLNFLPERHTDFIFSVMGEEWGFFGSLVLILLYFFLIKRGLAIAAETRDVFGRLVAVGVVTMLCFQVVVNIGMSMGLMPVVGLPLPFMSYGGSSLVASMFSVGLLVSVGMKKR